MKRRYWYIFGSVLALGLITVGVLLVLPKSPISNSIKNQLTSTLFVPSAKQIIINRASAKYDPGLKLLTYHAAAYGKTIIISEQPTPDSFVDIPDVYTKLVDGMREYKEFDVSAGTVHLTRPASEQGKQAAVLNAAGTLLFAKPSADLTDDQWRQFFDSLITVR